MQRARNQETTEGIFKLIDKLGELGWYHSIDLPDGTVVPGIQTLESLRTRINRYPIPQDLRGKRVLDIGAWDGWFSFEMERRGATVLAVDSARQETFFEAKRMLNSKVDYMVADICQLSPRDVGYFDIVLFFGVLYHLKHPLLALERVCELATEMACVETLVTDDPATPEAIPLLEFYETTELAGQYDNWCGPNTSCLMAFLRTAGFVNPKLLAVADYRAHTVAYRKWPQIARTGPAPEIVCIENTWTRDHNFRSGCDHHFTLWFNSRYDELNADNVFVEVGPYAVRSAGVKKIGDTGWQANCMLSPGAYKGWYDVRVAVVDSAWSQPSRIAIDLSREERLSSQASDQIEIAGVTDGKTYEPDRVRAGLESCVSVWARGLPEVTHANVTLRLDGTDLSATYLSTPDHRALRQINAMIPPNVAPGEYRISVYCRGIESRQAPVVLFK